MYTTRCFCLYPAITVGTSKHDDVDLTMYTTRCFCLYPAITVGTDYGLCAKLTVSLGMQLLIAVICVELAEDCCKCQGKKAGTAV